MKWSTFGLWDERLCLNAQYWNSSLCYFLGEKKKGKQFGLTSQLTTTTKKCLTICNLLFWMKTLLCLDYSQDNIVSRMTDSN